MPAPGRRKLHDYRECVHPPPAPDRTPDTSSQ
jgi:hypothetical protein